MAAFKPPAASFESYTVRIEIDALNIRATPETVSTNIVGSIKDRGVYTIVEVRNGFGKLKSGAGWVNLDYTKMI
jgi:N-acetylmuramoyl-L-alanine amidase